MSPEHKELRLLGKVEHVFSITGRGVVIVPLGSSDLGLHRGDSIQLRAPGGQVRRTSIAALESMNQGQGRPRRPALMLPVDVAKDEIMEGMEIWS